MQEFSFSQTDLNLANRLFDQDKVKNVFFSEGTYQVEIAELKSKSVFWPFLQLNDDGRILDCFCTCKSAEKNKTCPHLAAALLKIFNGKNEPLHVRFRESLWNQLCQIASRRHGYSVDVLKGGKELTASSVTGKRLFYIKYLNENGKKLIKEVVSNREAETEETSLKFSNLPAEELVLWKEGRPSHNLRYELSFWSDLAKLWMRLQDRGAKYKIIYLYDKKSNEKAPLPKWILADFLDVEFGFYISEANWPQIIPSLSTVESSLGIYDFSDQKIRKMDYDPLRKVLVVDTFAASNGKKQMEAKLKGYEREIGDWIYISEIGFYPKSLDPVFKEKEIPEQKISYVLNTHPKFVQKHLRNAKVHWGGIKAQYLFFFDQENRLHIQCYVFKPGDLKEANAAYFGPWVYLPEKGFYLLEGLLFEAEEKIIPKDQVCSFIDRHRHLLHSYEGFQIHLSNLESQFSYSVSSEGVLSFDARFDIEEELGEIIDLEEWIYIKGKGFYAKSSRRGGTIIKPGMKFSAPEVSGLISGHREELEGVRGFFSSRCPIDKMGVKIVLNERSQITVLPEFSLIAPYQLSQVRIFGDYAYVDREGFSEIPPESRLPPAFTEKKTISSASEPYFIAYELDMLKRYALLIDPRLCKPARMHLRIHQLKKDQSSRVGEWVLEMVYETDIGTVSAYEIWRALQDNKRHLFSSAGLILVKDIRYSWLKSISKKRWLKKGKLIRLNTLEWLKLTIFEDVKEPEGKTKAIKESRNLFQELKNFQSSEAVNLSGLKSDLRPYQEIGVRWLFFLYCRGLSGLLCDEMGLGKTHQAMALLAAVMNMQGDLDSEESIPKKILVVCPTSVIYHWEGLLKKFLPGIKVKVFYGLQRSLEQFQHSYDLLLTSYGVLRGERNNLNRIDFEVAIFDEIQIAKNAHSQTHKALRSITSKMRLGLTGTPIENRLLELKSIFDVVLPNYLPSDAVFKEHFIHPIERNQDQEKKQLLSKLVKPFILRRKKSEVLLELPEKTEEIAYCDLSEEQSILYKNAFNQQRESLLNSLHDKTQTASYVHVFALFSMLKQICDHPCLVTKKIQDYAKHKSGKWDLFVELLEEARESNQKLVVFSQYLGMLDIIETYLKEKKIGFAGIRGSTTNRKDQLERFRDDPSCVVFVASLQAAGVGIDLVAASVVIHYDRWWNPAKENQATDRVHRIGQSRGVQVFKMVTKNTIEEHIHKMIEKKMSLMEGIIGFDEKDQIKGLEREELIQLLHLIHQDLSSEGQQA